jgi:hypothetical protein
VASKKRGRQRRRPGSIVVPPPPAIIDLGRTVPVTVKKGSDDDVTLSLSDGTKLKMKPVVIGIERSLGKYNAMGEPIYQIQAGFIMQFTVPKSLKRKAKAP